MDEYIRIAICGSNEAKPLGSVEPLYGSLLCEEARVMTTAGTLIVDDKGVGCAGDTKRGADDIEEWLGHY